MGTAVVQRERTAKGNRGAIFMGWVEFCPAVLFVCVCACVKDLLDKGGTVSVGFKRGNCCRVLFKRASLCRISSENDRRLGSRPQVHPGIEIRRTGHASRAWHNPAAEIRSRVAGLCVVNCCLFRVFPIKGSARLSFLILYLRP